MNAAKSAMKPKNNKTSSVEPSLKVIYKKKYIQEDHEQHIDERWLVSYSDMMTLLFGLFVMLYSMQSPDAIKRMQDSIQQNFAENKKPTTVVEKVDVQVIQAELEKALYDSSRIKLELEDEKRKAEAIKISQIDNNKETSDLKFSIQNHEDEKRQMSEELAQLKNEKNILSRQIASVQDSVGKPEPSGEIIKEKDESIAKLKKVIQKKEEDIKKMASRDDFKKEYEHEKDKNQALDQRNLELMEKIKSLENKGSFLAIILNWFTTEHDLDLTITDPNGKKFNFKSKQYPNYPGKMVLDTRRGPGAEIWQADKIIPGTYKAEISFYNQYGNPAPAEGKLVIFSPKGNVEVPNLKLDFKGRSKEIIAFDIDANGAIQLKK
ncbi:MAG: hypothetical protein J0M15_11720 [Deltaproteobacteria bacterium]|jgi:flagellar motor protein MotB|nr:hypothetical protein [Deltaproteobacteria bacterium]